MGRKVESSLNWLFQSVRILWAISVFLFLTEILMGLKRIKDS